MRKLIVLFLLLFAFSLSAQNPTRHARGVIIGAYASDPTGVDEGQIYWNNVSEKFRYYDGTVWADLGGSGGSINIEDEGVVTVTAATILNFVGSAVTVTDAGSGEATITIVGGSSESTSVSDTATLDLTLTGSDITGDVIESALTITESQISDLTHTTNTTRDIATSAEVDTGTDNVKAISPLALAGSQLQTDVTANNAKVTFPGFTSLLADYGYTEPTHQLSDLTDVNTSTATNRNVLVADGVDWESRPLVEADISDLQSYLLSEVDGSISNELQTIANTSNATSHTATLSDSGGSTQFVEGPGITLTTTGTGLNGIVTIASTASGATNLSSTHNATTVDIESDTGTNATINLANGTTAGVSENNITDAEKTVIGNTSGTNTGDNAVNSLYSGLVSNVTTNLSVGTITATTLDVNSSDGTNATLPEANTTQAGS